MENQTNEVVEEVVETAEATTEKKSSKGLLIGGIVLAVLIIAFAAVALFVGKGTKGSKAIVIEVTNKAGETQTYNTKTDAEFLKDAMDEVKGLEYSGTDSGFGLFVDTVNGETASYEADSSYWAIYVNGEYGMYGIDAQPVADGDTYGFVYTIDNWEE